MIASQPPYEKPASASPAITGQNPDAPRRNARHATMEIAAASMPADLRPKRSEMAPSERRPPPLKKLTRPTAVPSDSAAVAPPAKSSKGAAMLMAVSPTEAAQKNNT